MVLNSSFQKAIATSLFCPRCLADYQPNEYYRHLSKCERDARTVSQLLLEKDSIDRQISAMRRKEQPEVDSVVVLLKSRGRATMTSRPKAPR